MNREIEKVNTYAAIFMITAVFLIIGYFVVTKKPRGIILPVPLPISDTQKDIKKTSAKSMEKKQAFDGMMLYPNTEISTKIQVPGAGPSVPSQVQNTENYISPLTFDVGLDSEKGFRTSSVCGQIAIDPYVPVDVDYGSKFPGDIETCGCLEFIRPP